MRNFQNVSIKDKSKLQIETKSYSLKCLIEAGALKITL